MHTLLPSCSPPSVAQGGRTLCCKLPQGVASVAARLLQLLLGAYPLLLAPLAAPAVSAALTRFIASGDALLQVRRGGGVRAFCLL